MRLGNLHRVYNVSAFFLCVRTDLTSCLQVAFICEGRGSRYVQVSDYILVSGDHLFDLVRQLFETPDNFFNVNYKSVLLLSLRSKK